MSGRASQPAPFPRRFKVVRCGNCVSSTRHEPSKICAIPPGNRLERLRGDRDGQLSIRINDQWRICFAWTKGDVTEVEIVDYH